MDSEQGKSNKAIEADLSTLTQYSQDVSASLTDGEIVNEKKCIYMSPEDSGFQFNGHGAIWWFFYFAIGDPTLASVIAARYPYGAYWMYTFVK